MAHARTWKWSALLAGIALACWIGVRWRMDHRYDRTIRRVASRYGVDPALVKAVVWRESGFQAGCRGKAGEIGLMQLRELAAVEWASAERVSSFELEHLADPATNIQAGTWYLARLLKRYEPTDRPEVYALADYNAGRSNVRRWLKDNPAATTNSAAFMDLIGYPMTRRYVETVLKRRQRYRWDFAVIP